MTNKSEDILRDAKNLALTEKERETMRAHLVAKMEGTPVISPISTFSVQASLERLVHVRALHTGRQAWRRFAPIALGLFLTVGIGTSYAAEGALPGDVLYPVKIYINESVKTSLARTPKESAKVEADLAIKRLEEAEVLEKSGRLDEKKHKEIKKNFNAKVKALDRGLQELQRDGDFASTVEVNMEFESDLNAHGEILSKLIDEDAEAAPAVTSFSERATAARTESASTTLQMSASKEEDTALKPAASATQPQENAEEDNDDRSGKNKKQR